MAEENLAKLTEVKKFFEIEKTSYFTREWIELSDADRHEIRQLVYKHYNN